MHAAAGIGALACLAATVCGCEWGRYGLCCGGRCGRRKIPVLIVTSPPSPNGSGSIVHDMHGMRDGNHKSLTEELHKRSMSKPFRRSGSFEGSSPEDLARSPDMPAAFRNAAFALEEPSEALSVQESCSFVSERTSVPQGMAPQGLAQGRHPRSFQVSAPGNMHAAHAHAHGGGLPPRSAMRAVAMSDSLPPLGPEKALCAPHSAAVRVSVCITAKC